MKNLTQFGFLFIAAASTTAFGIGGRGGAGFGGGRGGGPALGGARPAMPAGGGNSGGASRPAPAPTRPSGGGFGGNSPAQRPASMGMPELRPNRPTTLPAAGAGIRPGGAGGVRPGSGGAGGVRPGSGGAGVQRPGAAGAGAVGGGASRTGGAGGTGMPSISAGGPGAYARPNAKDLDGFLGTHSGTRSTSEASRSWTGNHGGSVTVDKKVGSVTGPGGNTVAGAGKRLTFTGPNGATGTKVSGVAGSSTGRWGAGSVSGVQGRNGYTAVKVSGAGGIAGVGGRAGSVNAVRGPYGNTIAYGRGASFVGGNFVRGHAWGAVNGAYVGWGAFHGNWHTNYRGCWWPGKWAVAGAITYAAWATFGWSDVSSYAYSGGAAPEPVYYDYGGDVNYNQGDVYYGDQKVSSSADYYDKSVEVSDAGDVAPAPAEAEKEEWLPLGVYVVLDKDKAEKVDTSKPIDRVLQIAINKAGIVRGNFQESTDAEPVEVRGALDKPSQLISLHMVKDNKRVLETGLYNFTNDEVPAILIFGPKEADHRDLVLVRLKNPDAGEMKPAASK